MKTQRDLLAHKAILFGIICGLQPVVWYFIYLLLGEKGALPCIFSALIFVIISGVSCGIYWDKYENYNKEK